MTALLGKKINAYVGNVGDVLSQLKSGDIRALGVMDTEESPFLPGVKTFESQGINLLVVRGAVTWLPQALRRKSWTSSPPP
jgi:tripartite-type tricarboxylate transporter receptor subunit TctC